MINKIWVSLALLSILSAALLDKVGALSESITASAKAGVNITISLLGLMIFWLGLMKVLQKTGALNLIARGLKRPLNWLFPEVPENHPAKKYIIMNMTANMLGLGNAATPFGLLAMRELNTLNKNTGVATNAMVLFLAINTSSIALLPLSMISLRAAEGSQYPGIIIITTFFATLCSTIIAIIAAKILQNYFKYTPLNNSLNVLTEEEKGLKDWEDNIIAAEKEITTVPQTVKGASLFLRLSLILSTTFFLVYMAFTKLRQSSQNPLLYEKVKMDILGNWVIIVLILFILAWGWLKDIPIYETMIEGGKEALTICKNIVPYLVIMLVVLGMVRSSGFLNIVIDGIPPTFHPNLNLGFLRHGISPLMETIGLPPEGLFMGIIRTLSGSGATGYATEIMQNPTLGPDSYIGVLVSTMAGSTETTFYVLALYFGVANIKNSRHAIPACLMADAAGMMASLYFVNTLLKFPLI